MNIRKLTLIIATTLLGLALLSWIFNYLTTGELIVEPANQAADITIAGPTDTQKHRGGFRGRVKAGEYKITAVAGSAESSVAVKVSTRQQSRVELPLREPQSAIRAISAAVQSMAIGANSLAYHNTDSGALFRAGPGPDLQKITGLTFKDVKWFSDTRALAVDRSNGLYMIDGDRAERISSSILEEYGDPINTAIDKKNGSFVLSIGKNIYQFASPTAQPKKVFTASRPYPHLAYAKNALVVFYPEEDTEHGEEVQPQATNWFINLTSNNKAQLPNGIFAVEISSNQTRFAATDSDFIRLYSLSDGSQEPDIIPTSSRILAWQSPDALLYSHNGALWQYTLSARLSQKLAILTAATDPTYITLAPDGKSAYFSVYPSRLEAGIYQAYLSGSASEILTKLSQLLPQQTSNYSIESSSIGGAPAITITTMATLNRLDQLDVYRQQTAEYRAQALKYLRAKNIDPAALTITYIPAD